MGGWRRLPKRLGGGYRWLPMPLMLAPAVRETVAGRRLGALERGGGFQCIPGSGHGNLAKPAHHKALEKSLGIKDQSCPMLRLPHKAMWWRTGHVVRVIRSGISLRRDMVINQRCPQSEVDCYCRKDEGRLF